MKKVAAWKLYQMHVIYLQRDVCPHRSRTLQFPWHVGEHFDADSEPASVPWCSELQLYEWRQVQNDAQYTQIVATQ